MGSARFTESDARWMRHALDLAKRGRGRVEPNPVVGAILVAGGRVVGEGYHERFGGPHAEINALADAGEHARGATLYVTLEPCSTFGKTPPCTDAVVRAGVKEVIIGALDPAQPCATPILCRAGIRVRSGLLEQECVAANARFFCSKLLSRPFVLAKWAMTIDGKIATRSGDARWITNERSRAHVHELRAQFPGVMIGVGTAIADDPELTVRLCDGKNPTRIVVDTHCRLPVRSRLLRTIDRARLIVACGEDAPSERRKVLEKAGAELIDCPLIDGRVDLRFLLGQLHARGMDAVLVEGGSTLLGSMFDSGLIDRIVAFVAPKLVGGADAPSSVGGHGVGLMKQAQKLVQVEREFFDEDVCLSGDVAGAAWVGVYYEALERREALSCVQESSPFGLPSPQRLRNSAEIQRVIDRGRCFKTTSAILYALPNSLSYPRACAIAGKRFGNAVARNRAKRRLRECFRLLKAGLPPVDIVLIARKGGSWSDFNTLKEEIAKVLAEIQEGFKETKVVF